MTDYISSDLSADDKDSWATPDWLYQAMNSEFNFCLDACANSDNAKHRRFITKEQDALSLEHWSAPRNRFVWINPPYSRGMIKAFIDKAFEQCVTYQINSCLLVPATPDANWWPTNYATEIRFITGGRVSFVNPITGKSVNGNTKGSALIIFKHLDIGHGTVTRYVNRDRLREIGESILNQSEPA